jgi:hypothetical protein
MKTKFMRITGVFALLLGLCTLSACLGPPGPYAYGPAYEPPSTYFSPAYAYHRGPYRYASPSRVYAYSPGHYYDHDGHRDHGNYVR